MKELLILLIHLLTTVARLLRPGGVKAIITDNLLTIRREFLDQILFWNANDLVQKLEEFRQYYNTHLVHTAPDEINPEAMSESSVIRLADLDKFQSKSHCHSLYQLPAAT